MYGIPGDPVRAKGHAVSVAAAFKRLIWRRSKNAPGHGPERQSDGVIVGKVQG